MLDMDEVVDSALFRDWFVHSGDPEAHDLLEMYTYSYGETAKVRAVGEVAAAGVLGRDSVFTRGLILHSSDR